MTPKAGKVSKRVKDLTLPDSMFPNSKCDCPICKISHKHSDTEEYDQ